MHKVSRGALNARNLILSILLTLLAAGYIPHQVARASADNINTPIPAGTDNVAFDYFRAAFIAPAVVRVEWKSLAETDISDYILYRSDTLDGTKTLVTPTSIPATGFGGGAVYQFDDTTASTNHIYFYWLYVHVAPNNLLMAVDLPPAIAANQRIFLPMTFKK